MQNKSILWFIAVGLTGVCFSLLVVQRCCPTANVSGDDKYANNQFAKSMSSDPFGNNTVLDFAGYWTGEAWTGNDAPYAEARQEVEVSGISLKALETKYETTAQSQPKSTLAQFEWGYALRTNLANSPATTKGAEDAAAVFYSLTQAGDPHTYNYSRLRYLVSIRSRFLANLGERLLKHSPDDNPVKLHLIGDYAFDVGESGNPKSKLRAITLCQQLYKSGSKRSTCYSALGMVYEMSYSFRHNMPDGRAAIAAREKYLSLVDPQSEAAQTTRNSIAELKADLMKDSR